MRWRKERPRWGEDPVDAGPEGWPVPAVSWVHQVLVRRGLVDHRQRRRSRRAGGAVSYGRTATTCGTSTATRLALHGKPGFWVIDIVDDRFFSALGGRLVGDAAGWDAFASAVAAR